MSLKQKDIRQSTVTVEVMAGEEVEKNIVMRVVQSINPAKVSGIVTTQGADGVAIPVPGALVEALMRDSKSVGDKILPYYYSTRTDTSGKYELVLPADMYTIVVVKGGFSAAEQDVDLEPGDIVTQNFVLEQESEEGIGSLSGKVVTSLNKDNNYTPG